MTNDPTVDMKASSCRPRAINPLAITTHVKNLLTTMNPEHPKSATTPHRSFLAKTSGELLA
jgi:hypothetical protein